MYNYTPYIKSPDWNDTILITKWCVIFPFMTSLSRPFIFWPIDRQPFQKQTLMQIHQEKKKCIKNDSIVLPNGLSYPRKNEKTTIKRERKRKKYTHTSYFLPFNLLQNHVCIYIMEIVFIKPALFINSNSRPPAKGPSEGARGRETERRPR